MSQEPTKFDVRSRRLRMIAFLVGFCVMTLELIAGRLIAPYLGNSLYTWTAVLSAVLIAIVIGSYFGGKIAGQKSKFASIEFWLLLGSITTLITIFPLRAFIGPILQARELPLMILTLIFSLCIFSPPALSLAVIFPLLVKAEVKNVEESGRGFAQLAACNAGGSILGTYATGFFFIAYIPTMQVIVSIAAILFFMSVVEYARKRKEQIV